MEDIITLVGPRAVGKSSIGPIMAHSLGWEYVSLDDYITRFIKDVVKEKGGIDGFVKGHGWDGYYALMHEVLKILLKEKEGKKIVLDCGGGTTYSELPESELNAELLKRCSKMVLILPHEDEEKGLKVLLERERKRELFKGWSLQKLEEKIRKDYFERVPGMKKFAKEIIHCNEKSPKEVAKLVEELILSG